MPEPEQNPPQRVTRPAGAFFKTLSALVRSRILTGLLTILPLVLTAWLFWLVFSFLRDLSLWVFRQIVPIQLLELWALSPQSLHQSHFADLPVSMQWTLTGIALVLTFALLYAIGVFSANIIGARIIDWFEGLLERMPFVKSVYRTFKQILSLFRSKPNAYQRVGLVPWPSDRSRSLAFITSTLTDSQTGEELCVCFIPTTPNPTAGFVFVVRTKDVIEVDWGIEDSFKFILSGGMITNGSLTMEPPNAPARPK